MMHLRAYAKINLGLRILARRPDGFHDIETIFHQINLSDEITLQHSEAGIECITDGAAIPKNSNLCLRAARLLQSLTSTAQGATIYLQKRIPIGAGLGGGSSDAAAVLKGLHSLWNLGLSDERLLELALALGSDVPFFLSGGTAIGRGRGEILQKLDIPMPYWIVVCVPPLHVSTAWAYANIAIDTPRAPQFALSQLSAPRLDLTQLVNDFEPVVFRRYPEIAELKRELLRRGATTALMSGSGSSVFGLFTDEQLARRVADDLSHRYTVSLTEPFFKPEQLPIAQ